MREDRDHHPAGTGALDWKPEPPSSDWPDTDPLLETILVSTCW
ncbi:hypothetical protein AB0M47_38295 [Hamadaea sp. NPDC051192]